MKYFSIAMNFGLVVIEDAAQALLSTYKGKFLGAIGHIGCLSFHETKNVISGEGGAILVNKDLRSDLVDRAEIVWEKGTNRKAFSQGFADKYTWVQLGSSFLPSEIAAAFLMAQFEYAHEIIDKRRILVSLYRQFLKPLEDSGFVNLPQIPGADSDSNGHLFYILTSNMKERGRLIDFLARQGIMAVFHYVPLHSSPAGKKYGRMSDDLPVTDDISSRLLRLPLYFEMKPDDVAIVSEAVHQFYVS